MLIKYPGDEFGADVGFDHMGPAKTYVVGVALAPSGTTVPVAVASAEMEVEEDTQLSGYVDQVGGTIPVDAPLGTIIDGHVFILDSVPVVGEALPNTYGVNVVSPAAYSIGEPPVDLIALMTRAMMTMMVMNMMSGMGGEEGILGLG